MSATFCERVAAATMQATGQQAEPCSVLLTLERLSLSQAGSWQQPALRSLDGTNFLRVCRPRKSLCLDLSSGELLPEGGQFDAAGFCRPAHVRGTVQTCYSLRVTAVS